MDKIADRALRVAPSLTLALTAKGNKMKADGIDVVSFGAGEPDFNTPQYIIDAGKVALDKGMTKYTAASGTVELRKAIAAKFLKDNNLVYEPSQIVVSNGGKHALYNAFLAIINPGDEVILPSPYWLTYPELIKLCEGVPVVVDAKSSNDFKITPDELRKAITSKTKAIVFNNPSNPTGVVYSKSEIIELAKVLEEKDIYVISDEIYEKLCYGIEFFSIAQVSEKMKHNTIIINGLSKTYSMTGWRVGFTASNKEVAKVMDSMQSHTTSNPNSIAQYAGLIALTNNEGEVFLKEMQATFNRRKNLIVEKLKTMKPLSFIEPKGAFYIMLGIESFIGKAVDGQTIKSASNFADLLLEKSNVIAIPCESFGADNYIRLSYAISDASIIKGLDRINEFTKLIK